MLHRAPRSGNLLHCPRSDLKSARQDGHGGVMLGFRFACQQHQEIFVDTVQRVGRFNPEQMEDIRRQLLARLSEKFSLLVLDCFNTGNCIACALDANGVGACEICGIIEELARASKVPPASL